MRRRNFIAGLASTAAAWPVAAHAQQTEPLRRIGVLMNRRADTPEGRDQVTAFQQGLQKLGWSDGRNVRIDICWGENDLTASASARRNWWRSCRMSF